MIKKKLKIAVYSGDVPSTTFIERLVRGLSNSGHQILLFGFLKHHVSYNQNVSLITYRNSKLRKGLHLIRYSLLLSTFRSKDKAKLDSILKKRSKNLLLDKVKSYPVLWHRPDIFHLQWAKGISDWMWVQDFGMKLILGLRGAHINYSPIASLELAETYRNCFPRVTAFHAVSNAIAKEAQKYGADSNKIKVVYSGLDITGRSDLKKNTDPKFMIISIGRPHWVKGYTYAIDACQILKEKNVNFQYTIIGGGDDIEYKYQIHDLGLQDHVHLLPQTPYETVKDMIQQSDLLLLPSVKEGVANVVLEAMALETIVLTTSCGGIEEVISDGSNGFICPIRNAQQIANKIEMIINTSQSEKADIIYKAQDYVKKHHNAQGMIHAMLELYQSV